MKRLDDDCSFICIQKKLEVVGFQKNKKLLESVTIRWNYDLGKSCPNNVQIIGENFTAELPSHSTSYIYQNYRVTPLSSPIGEVLIPNPLNSDWLARECIQ